MIYFRVDGNEKIATGHVMRCLAIANAITKMGEESTFILADARPMDLINRCGYASIILDTVWTDMDTEIEVLSSYIRENNVEKLLLDSYYVTRKYLSAISKITRVVYIDDLQLFDYPVDTIINYSFLADEKKYIDMYGDSEFHIPQLLLGRNYVPLREEFSDCRISFNEQVKNVFVTTGGTDEFNVAGRILKMVKEDASFSAINFHVVVGCFNANKEALEELAKDTGNIFLYHNVTNMVELMQKCDVAVSAGGTTISELCTVGIPTVCFSIADNQRTTPKVLDKEEIIVYAGDVVQDGDACIRRILAAVHTFSNSREMHKKYSQNMRQMIDGQGSKRIAEYMLISR